MLQEERRYRTANDARQVWVLGATCHTQVMHRKTFLPKAAMGSPTQRVQTPIPWSLAQAVAEGGGGGGGDSHAGNPTSGQVLVIVTVIFFFCLNADLPHGTPLPSTGRLQHLLRTCSVAPQEVWQWMDGGLYLDATLTLLQAQAGYSVSVGFVRGEGGPTSPSQGRGGVQIPSCKALEKFLRGFKTCSKLRFQVIFPQIDKNR